MLKEFNWIIPTEVIFGEGREEEIGQVLVRYGAKNVLIIIGKNSVIKSGLLNRVIKNLEKENITYEILSGVRANPTFELVKQGKEIVIEKGIDFLLPIGGGSVIDTAKCIAVNAYHDGAITDFNFRVAKPEKALPIGVILTISAAGSEMSSSCVIQDDETGVKKGFNSDVIRPKFVIENPVLTYSVNKEQTAYGVIDIMMHTLERYFTYSDKYELADELALGLIKNVKDVGLVAYKDPENYDARARLMLDSSISHCGITNVGKNYIMSVHALEHALSGKFVHVAHALGLTILFPAWAKKYYIYDKAKFARLGRYVFDICEENDEKAALECIKAFEKYFAKFNLPTRLSEVGVKEKDIDDLVNLVTKNGTTSVPHHKLPIDSKVAKEIYLEVL